MRSLRRGAFALALIVGMALPTRAETLVEKVNEARTYLYFKVAELINVSAVACYRRDDFLP